MSRVTYLYELKDMHSTRWRVVGEKSIKQFKDYSYMLKCGKARKKRKHGLLGRSSRVYYKLLDIDRKFEALKYF